MRVTSILKNIPNGINEQKKRTSKRYKKFNEHKRVINVIINKNILYEGVERRQTKRTQAFY